jgi:hypothetical protein
MHSWDARPEQFRDLFLAVFDANLTDLRSPSAGGDSFHQPGRKVYMEGLGKQVDIGFPADWLDPWDDGN